MDPYIMCFDPITNKYFLASPLQLELAQKHLNDILKYSENGEVTLDDYCDSLGIGRNEAFGKVVIAKLGAYRKIVFAKKLVRTENGDAVKIEILKPGDV